MKYKNQISNIKYQKLKFRKETSAYTKSSSACCLVPNAFTLIELLVVITIIGILSTLGLVSFGAAQVRARDSQRKSDLRQIQTALRAYYNENGGYPAQESATDFRIKGCGPQSGRTVCSWGSAWTTTESRTYMEFIPKDPKSDWNYQYERASLDSYILTACLENANDTSGVATTVCSSGKKYEVKQ